MWPELETPPIPAPPANWEAPLLFGRGGSSSPIKVGGFWVQNVLLRGGRLVLERLWEVVGGCWKGDWGQRRGSGAQGRNEVGVKGCVVCSPDACTGWTWEGHWHEGWMWGLGGVQWVPPLSWGDVGGNGVETLGSESCKQALG